MNGKVLRGTQIAKAPVVIEGAVPKSGGRKNRCVAGKVELPSESKAMKHYGGFLVAVTPCSKGEDATSPSITM